MKIGIFIVTFFATSAWMTNPKVLSTHNNSSFLNFIDQIENLKIGYSINCNERFKHQDIENEFIPDGASLLGKLKSFDGHHFIIFTYPADIRLPILEVYDDNGLKKLEKQLFDYSACGFESPNTASSFSIIDDSTIKIQNFKTDDETIIKTEIVDLNEIIK